MEFRPRYGSHHLDKSDRAPLRFQPAYFRKIHHSLKFDPTARYQKLATFLNDLKMTDEAKWFEN